MNDELSLTIRKEIKSFLEEEKAKKMKNDREASEKGVKTTNILLQILILTLASFSYSMSHLSFYFYLVFLPIFIISSIISTKISKSNLHPETKSFLLLFPAFIYLAITVLPIVLSTFESIK